MRLGLAVAALLCAQAAAAQPEVRLLGWEAKVHPSLRAVPPEREQEMLVVLGDQADLSGARDLPTKAEKGQFVFEQLTAAARRAQAPLLAELDALGVSYQSFWLGNVIRVRGDRTLIESLARRADVERIVPDRAFPVRLPLPEKTSPESGLGLESAEAVAATPEWNIVKIGAPSVWAAGFTGQGVVVAGADTGYDWTHPALKGKYRGWNGTTADHNYNWHDAIHNATPGNKCKSDAKAPCDDDTHGTHTMGIMVGDGGSGNQIGVAPGAKWIGCRNMDEGTGTPARYIECFQFFLAPTDLNNANADPSKAPDVINNSWDCPPSEGCTDPAILKSIIETVRAAGIAVVVAGGNEGPACNSMDVPEPYAASISVGATDSSDAVASYSSRGPGDGGIIKPEIVAPGSSIRSCVPGGGYATMSGTSMASPHVGGMAALLLSAAPGLSGNVTGLQVVMEKTAVAKTTTETCGGVAAGAVPNNTAGYGRIDALAAYGSATAPNLPPSVNLTSPASGDVFSAPATIALAAAASDPDGAVFQVDFFSGSTRIASVTSAPFTFNWIGVPAGSYTLSAVAFDIHGASAVSASVSVTVGAGTALPAPWQAQDIGAVGVAGSASFAFGSFTVAGSGADIWGTADQFQFVYQSMVGDGEIRARVVSLDNTNSYAKVGVMVRQDLTASAPYAMVEIQPRKASAFQWRLTPGGTSAAVASSGAAPYWVRLVRAGNVFTAYRSADGVTWVLLGTTTISLPSSVSFGLAVSAHNNTTTNTAVFDNVTAVSQRPNSPPAAAITSPADGAAFDSPASISIEAQASDSDGTVTQVAFYDGSVLLGTLAGPPYTYDWANPSPGGHSLTVRATDNSGAVTTSAAVAITVNDVSSQLPAPWQEQDIGAVGVAGSASDSSGTFTVAGSGADIWGTSDQFHFVYQPMAGDGEIRARVVSLQNTNSYAKIGVMIRQDLSVSSPYAMVEIQPRKASAFQWRLTAGGTSAAVASSGAAPYWVRLVRSGSTFTAYRSADGTSWVLLGTTTISLPSNVYFGLAVSAHNNTTTNTAVFDNVTATP